MKYLYKKFAEYYDLIYSKKNYSKETNFIENLIKKYKIKGKKILDLGCGTGSHAIHLNEKGFDVFGIDISKEILKVAKNKSKKATFLKGDMKNFRLKKEFDIVLCLFSTIHYNQSFKELKKTLKNIYSHLKKGGLLIFDMGFNEERWKEGYSHIESWSNKKIELVRFSKSIRQKNFGILNMAYILFKNNKFYFGKEKHKLKIFKTLEVKKLTEKLGFKTYLYEDYTSKHWKKNSKKYVVFVCIKK